MDLLLRHSWPGNIRELRNAIERAILLSQGEEISVADLPPTFRSGVSSTADLVDTDTLTIAVPGWRSMTLSELRSAVVTQAERQHLETLLETTGGRVGEAARRAGIDRRTLYERMRAYGLDKQSFRRRPLH